MKGRDTIANGPILDFQVIPSLGLKKLS